MAALLAVGPLGGGAAMSEHTCHAQGCETEVPPAMFMCRRHWFMVPKAMRDEIWRTYRRGQEITKTPSLEYLDAARSAIQAVAVKEGRAA